MGRTVLGVRIGCHAFSRCCRKAVSVQVSGVSRRVISSLPYWLVSLIWASSVPSASWPLHVPPGRSSQHALRFATCWTSHTMVTIRTSRSEQVSRGEEMISWRGAVGTRRPSQGSSGPLRLTHGTDPRLSQSSTSVKCLPASLENFVGAASSTLLLPFP